MTLNAWFRPPLRERSAEITAWIAAAAPHIVCLQEVARPEGHAETQADLIAAGLPGPWNLEFAGAAAGSGGLAGNAVLSRWPIQASEVLPLPGDDALPKSVLHACTGGLDVFSAHLASAPEGAGMRERQVVIVENFIRSRAAADAALPPLLAGDFNATPGSSTIRFLRGEQTLHGLSAFYQDAWAAGGDGGPGHTWTRRNPHTPPAHLYDARCDYIFVGTPRVPLSWSGGDDPRVQPAGQVLAAALVCTSPLTGVMASDHYGVAADICWPAISQA